MKKLGRDIWSVGGSHEGAILFVNKANGIEHKSFKNNITDTLVGGEWLPWGEDNLYPQNLFKKLKKTGVALGGLNVLTSAHFGAGFSLCEKVETENGVSFRERLSTNYPDINDFFRRSKYNLLNAEIIVDSETWGLAFPEYVTSPNFDKIVSVRRIKAADCRFQKPNTNTNTIHYIGVNTDWENFKGENTAKIRCFSPYDPIEKIKEECKNNKITNFTIPIIDPLIIEKTYPIKGWHSSFSNGWVDVVLALPEFKKAMFNQQLNVKYLIHVSDEYFQHIYAQGEWEGFTNEEKDAKRKQLIDAIDKELRGNNGAGKSIISPYFKTQDGDLVKGIQIETIEQAQSNGDFLLDGSAANYEILTPMGVDPCLINGGAFGGKNLSGSGSDKREAWTILCAKMPLRQIHTLQIFENIKDWNGWPENLHGKFPQTNLTTLDKNPNGQEKIIA